MIKNIVFLVFSVVIFLSCENNYFPKPRGFFHIALPQKEYITFDSASFPYSFNRPVYTNILPDLNNPQEKYWIDIHYPSFDASLHLSYKKVQNNLNVYLEDSRTFVNKHIPKANAIQENIYINEKDSVFGLVYNIEGSEAASPFQFYLTDSTHHFVRGALYFNFTPNNDSLAPVINFIKEDIYLMIETFEWK